ncbi:MAG TPA: HlyD family secretion protein [Pyrinomonadaceae bacterium]|nr:HlyD family secretion protein [Pyrinomonadaceae bacterium]
MADDTPTFAATGDGADSPFLDTDPPHWAARGLAYLLILLFVGVVSASLLIRIPETVSAPFILVPAEVKEGDVTGESAGTGGSLQAELTVPETGVGRIESGQAVKLLYRAFPYQRYGVRHGTLKRIEPTSQPGTFRAVVEIADASVRVQGQSRPLLAGMGGTAQMVVGRRSLMSYAFEPVYQLKENLSAPR